MRFVIGALLLLFTSASAAEQYQTLGKWDVHYMVVSTTFLTPQIAKANKIVRSKYSALVNISVLNRHSKQAQNVAVNGTAKNLLGTEKTLNFKKVQDGEAIYYLAVLPYRHREQYRFNIKVQHGNAQQTLKFKQELFVD